MGLLFCATVIGVGGLLGMGFFQSFGFVVLLVP